MWHIESTPSVQDVMDQSLNQMSLKDYMETYVPAPECGKRFLLNV